MIIYLDWILWHCGIMCIERRNIKDTNIFYTLYICKIFPVYIMYNILLLYVIIDSSKSYRLIWYFCYMSLYCVVKIYRDINFRIQN